MLRSRELHSLLHLGEAQLRRVPRRSRLVYFFVCGVLAVLALMHVHGTVLSVEC